MLPIEINGTKITTAEEAAASLKTLLGERKIREAVNAMEWLAGDNVLREAFRDPALVVQLANAAKYELAGSPEASPDDNILRLMHGAPGFMENLREDERFVARVGETGWGALAGSYNYDNGARQAYNHLKQTAGLVIDVDAATAAATRPEYIKAFAERAGEDLGASVLKDKRPGVTELHDKENFRHWHERAKVPDSLAAYISLAKEHPFLAPALEDETLAVKVLNRATELMKHQPTMLGDLGLLADTVASSPVLDQALRSVEGVDAALENVLAKPSLPNDYGSVALMRNAEGKTRMNAGIDENIAVDRAFFGTFTGFNTIHGSRPNINEAVKIIGLVEKARTLGWAVENDIAGIVHDVECMGSMPTHVARQHYQQFRALLPQNWHGIAVLALAEKNEALQKSARPGSSPVATRTLMQRLTRG